MKVWEIKHEIHESLTGTKTFTKYVSGAAPAGFFTRPLFVYPLCKKSLICTQVAQKRSKMELLTISWILQPFEMEKRFESSKKSMSLSLSLFVLTSCRAIGFDCCFARKKIAESRLKQIILRH